MEQRPSKPFARSSNIKKSPHFIGSIEHTTGLKGSQDGWQSGALVCRSRTLPAALADSVLGDHEPTRAARGERRSCACHDVNPKASTCPRDRGHPGTDKILTTGGLLLIYCPGRSVASRRSWPLMWGNSGGNWHTPNRNCPLMPLTDTAFRAARPHPHAHKLFDGGGTRMYRDCDEVTVSVSRPW